MARRTLSTRRPFRLLVALPLTALAACTGGPPQACSLELFVGSVGVDVGGLDVDTATVEALLCVEDDCGAGYPGHGGAAVVGRTDLEIPSRDRVEVRVVLTDPGTGAELYRGRGEVPVEVVEPNGPGCGESRTLPEVVAEPDGSLRT